MARAVVEGKAPKRAVNSRPKGQAGSSPANGTMPGIRTESGRFAPGVSGNPAGRPKAATDFRNLAREHGEQALKTLVRIIGDDKAQDKDRIQASQIVLDRAYGKCSNEAAVIAEESEIPEALRNMTDAELAEALKGMQ